MSEIQAPDMEKSNLRPKSFACQVAVDKLHASWTEVIKIKNNHSSSFRNMKLEFYKQAMPSLMFCCYFKNVSFSRTEHVPKIRVLWEIKNVL